ncbi:MAG TPA: alpha/beta hydrolase, partial [Candidatus Limnocylindrales bacterium]
SPALPAWARLLLVHGLAEHSGRYEHVGERLAAAGIEVHAADQRGFGASGGRRAWVDRWSQLHDDIEHRVAGLRAASPALPVVVYGHSLGGLIALGYVLDGRSLPDLLVLSAPAVGASVPAWQRALVAAMSRVAPGTRLANRLPEDVLAKSPAVWTDYLADPLNEHRSTARFGALALAEQRRVAAALDRLAIPTLVIHGGDDRLVPTATSELFESREGVTRRVYPGVRHELHNEPEGPAVLDDVVAWIRANVRSA